MPTWLADINFFLFLRLFLDQAKIRKNTETPSDRLGVRIFLACICPNPHFTKIEVALGMRSPVRSLGQGLFLK
jgi:hypothetical protein